MPNWCSNDVTIKHKDKKAIERVFKAFNEGRLCEEFIPVPKDLKETTSPNKANAKEMKEKYGHEDWYSFQTSNWGTKWDVEPGNAIIKGKAVYLTFDSAWSPPIGLYEKLLEDGYEVKAYYFEGGMGFYGEFDNGMIEESQYGNVSEIPDNIDKLFNVKEMYQEF